MLVMGKKRQIRQQRQSRHVLSKKKAAAKTFVFRLCASKICFSFLFSIFFLEENRLRQLLAVFACRRFSVFQFLGCF